MIEPLRDDCTERYSAFRVKWAKLWDGGRGLLRKSLLRQLRLRPDIEYKDLWANEEELQIATYSVRTCKELLGLPNERLVPGDTFEMIAAADAYGGDGFLDVLLTLEREFRLDLKDVIEKPTTLSDLVRYVREKRQKSEKDSSG